MPAVGSSKPAIIRSTVVLPEPDGPSMEKNSPSAMSRSMPATAWTGPNDLRSPIRRTAGSVWSTTSRVSDNSTDLELLTRSDNGSLSRRIVGQRIP